MRRVLALQPASTIQNACSHTDISATQITCCHSARHLLAIHGNRKRPTSHEIRWLRQSHTLALPSASHAEGRRILACPRRSRACEQDFQTPRDACANLRWAGRGTQAASTALISICARTRTHTCAYARPRTLPRTRTPSRTHAHKRTSAAGRICSGIKASIITREKQA